jgi:CHAT domain-containing protein
MVVSLKYVGLSSVMLALAMIHSPGQAAMTRSTTLPITQDVAKTSGNSFQEQGRRFYEQGQYTEAIAQWQQLHQTAEQQGDRLTQAQALNFLSMAQQQLGQWKQAKTTIEQSKTLLKAEQNVDALIWAQTLNTQANLQLLTGQTQSALDNWIESERYYGKIKDQQGIWGSRLNQAQALQSLGFYRRSRQMLEGLNQALQNTPASPLKVNSLRSLGNSLRVVGDLPGSKDALMAALDLAKSLGLVQEQSGILISLGNLAADSREPEVATEFLRQATQSASNDTERLQAKLNQLRLYAEWGEDQSAVEEAQQLLPLLQQMPNGRSKAYSAINLASSLSLIQGSMEARPIADLLAQSVQTARELQDPRAEAYGLSEMGQLYARRGQRDEGIQLIRQSLAIAEQLEAKDITAQSAWKLGRLLKEKGDRTSAIASYSEAVNALQALRGDLVAVNQDVQFSFRESVEPVYRELVALLLDNNPDQPALMKVRELIEGLQIAELDNFFREACLDAQPKQIDQIDRNAAVLYSIVLSDRVAVVASTSDPQQPLRYFSSPIKPGEAEASVKDLLASLHPASSRESRLAVSQKLYDWLIRPVEASGALKDRQTLVFVLDGLLRKVPVAALHDGKQYLIEKHSVALSPGLRLMSAQQQLAKQQVRAVVAGISEAREGFNALPSVAGEVGDISKATAGKALLNQNFTAQTLANQVQGNSANLVHLATHGQFSSNLDETFLLTWNGRMNIRELSDLLRNRDSGQKDALELLVLSACDTAAGDDRAVLGLAGLAVKSGARSTLASLWPVKDQVAARLMTQFYEELKQPNMTKAEALRRSQLALLKDKDFDDPFFWSSFVLVGNWL